RIRAAVEYRRQMVRDSDAYRVIFSEGDGLPGLIVDRYNDIASVQVLTQAFDRADFRQAILDRLAAELPVATIVERVDERIRALEQLPPAESRVLLQHEPAGEPRTATQITVNGVCFAYNAFSGQKTGAF